MKNQDASEKMVIAVVGTGLIGCSMADGLRDVADEIIGVDNNSRHLQEALYRGSIDKSMSLQKAVDRAGVIILSVPVDTVVRLLPSVLDSVDATTVVIDTGSVKGAVCGCVEDHPNRSRFVASHPMAGLAVSGPDAAESRLFRNRKVIVCEHEKSSEDALNTASLIFKKLAMEILFMEPLLHDISVARVSHLPQLMAYCLASLTGENNGNHKSLLGIASSGYESSTRLASSPAGMWIPIFQYNDRVISDALDDMISLLSGTRDMIRGSRWQSVNELIEKANRTREQFLQVYK